MNLVQPMQSPQAWVGQVLQRQYRVVRVLAVEGGTTLLEAQRLSPPLRCQIRLIPPDGALWSADLERERVWCKELASKHLVEVVDFGALPDGTAYFVTEYLEGETLDDRVSRLLRQEGPQVAQWLGDLAELFRVAALQGKAHGNLHLQSLLFSRRVGGVELLKVTGFGRFNPTVLEGMPGDEPLPVEFWYLSPEQVMGAPATPASDQFAIAALVFHALTGQPPFRGGSATEVLGQIASAPAPSLRSMAPLLPLSVDPIIQKAMAKDPLSRFSSIEVFVRTLSPLLRSAQKPAAKPKVVISESLLRDMPSQFTVRLDEVTRKTLETLPGLGTEKLSLAQALQNDTPCELVEALLQLDLIGESALLEAFATEQHARIMTSERVRNLLPAETLLKDIPEPLVARQRILPFSWIGITREIRVLAAVPVSPELEAELQAQTGARRVTIYLATPGAVYAAIRRFYRNDVQAFGALKPNGSGPVVPLPEMVLARPPSLPLLMPTPSAPIALVPSVPAAPPVAAVPDKDTGEFQIPKDLPQQPPRGWRPGMLATPAAPPEKPVEAAPAPAAAHEPELFSTPAPTFGAALHTDSHRSTTDRHDIPVEPPPEPAPEPARSSSRPPSDPSQDVMAWLGGAEQPQPEPPPPAPAPPLALVLAAEPEPEPVHEIEDSDVHEVEHAAPPAVAPPVAPVASAAAHGVSPELDHEVDSALDAFDAPVAVTHPSPAPAEPIPVPDPEPDPLPQPTPDQPQPVEPVAVQPPPPPEPEPAPEPAAPRPPRAVYVPEPTPAPTPAPRPPVILDPVEITRPSFAKPEITRPVIKIPTLPAFADDARYGDPTLGEHNPPTDPELHAATATVPPPAEERVPNPAVSPFTLPPSDLPRAVQHEMRREFSPRTVERPPVQLTDVVQVPVQPLPPPVADEPSPELRAAAQAANEAGRPHAPREQEITRPFRWVPAEEGVEVEVEVSFDEHEPEAPLSRSEGLMHRAIDRAAALLGADRVAIHLHSGSAWTGPTGAPVPRPVPQVIQNAAQAHPLGLHLDADYWRVFARPEWGPWFQGITDALVIPLENQGTLFVGATRRAEPFAKADLLLMQGLTMQVTQLLAEAHAPTGRVRLDLDAWCRGERFVERAALALLQDAEPRTNEVSMLCVGVRSLLASLQGLPPGQVLRTLNRTLEDISAVVHAYGGLIERVQGDGLVAIWGLEPADLDARHALWAGAAVVKRLAALGVAGATVGVHTDNMLLGRLRFGAQHHFTAVSHSLPHCWTLGQLAPGRLVTSRATLSRAGTQLPGRPEPMPPHLVEPGFPFAPFVLATDDRRMLGA